MPISLIPSILCGFSYYNILHLPYSCLLILHTSSLYDCTLAHRSVLAFISFWETLYAGAALCVFSASYLARPFVTIIEGGVSFRFISCHLIYFHLFLPVCILARAHCEHLVFSPGFIRDRSNVHYHIMAPGWQCLSARLLEITIPTPYDLFSIFAIVLIVY